MKSYFHKNYNLLVNRVSGVQSIKNINLKSIRSKSICLSSILRARDRSNRWLRSSIFFLLSFLLLILFRIRENSFVAPLKILTRNAQASAVGSFFLISFSRSSIRRRSFFYLRKLLLFFFIYLSQKFFNKLSAHFHFLLEIFFDTILQDLTLLESSGYCGNFVLKRFSNFLNEFGEIFSVKFRKRFRRFNFKLFIYTVLTSRSSCSSLGAVDFFFYDDFYAINSSLVDYVN